MNSRWSNCLDVMLEKKAGVRKIHQLRIIGLLKADFNTALKFYFAKHLIAKSEHTELTEEQCGWPPGPNSNQPSTHKALTMPHDSSSSSIINPNVKRKP